MGEHDPTRARAEDLRSTLAALLQEAFTALDEALAGLSDAHVWGYPVEGRHSIGTIAMHVIANLDFHACVCQGGASSGVHEDRFDVWLHSPEELRARLEADDLPTPAEVRGKLRAVRDQAVAILREADDAALAGPTVAAPDSYRRHDRTRVETYLRTLCHAHAHVRQIWALRGVMGRAGGDDWPEQHVA